MRPRFITFCCATLLTLLLGGCKDDEFEFNDEFTISSEDVTLEDDKLKFGPDRQTITIDVTTETATGKWHAICPTEDVWCSFSRKGGKLILTVDANDKQDKIRTTWIEFSLGDNRRKIYVEQDYKRKLSFADGASKNIGASADNIELSYLGNIPAANLTVSITNPADPSEIEWIENLRIEEGAVKFKAARNPSASLKRQVTLKLEGEGQEAQITVTQNELSGYPYFIDLSGADFNDALIYEIWDDVHDIKIGELCREFLHKTDEQSATTIVKMQALVAYPMLKEDNGKADLSNGLVVSNGGAITWNTAATSSTSPGEIISSYNPGSLSDAPDMIYMAEGAARMTVDPLEGVEEQDRVYATLKPYLVKDERSGAANNASQTQESYTYRVVKVGTQYWMAENLRTSRLRDGENIPTNLDNSAWSSAWKPGCLVGYRPLSDTRVSYLNANAPEAEAARNEYGCLYNFHAATQTETDDNTALENIRDMISPQGWNIPTSAQFELLRNYVAQSTGSSIAIPETSAYSSGEFANATGLSFKGNTSRGRTGGWNDENTNYIIIDTYSFNATADHRCTAFRIATSDFKCSFASGSGVTTRVGNYIRCIRD